MIINFWSCLSYSVSKFGLCLRENFQFNPIHQLGIKRNTESLGFSHYPKVLLGTDDLWEALLLGGNENQRGACTVLGASWPAGHDLFPLNCVALFFSTEAASQFHKNVSSIQNHTGEQVV